MEMFSNVNLYVNLRRLASYLFTTDVRSTEMQKSRNSEIQKYRNTGMLIFVYFWISEFLDFWISVLLTSAVNRYEASLRRFTYRFTFENISKLGPVHAS